MSSFAQVVGTHLARSVVVGYKDRAGVSRILARSRNPRVRSALRSARRHQFINEVHRTFVRHKWHLRRSPMRRARPRARFTRHRRGWSMMRRR